MSHETSLKELIQNMIPEGVTIITGRIIGVNPLRVQVVNDQKLILSENTIVNYNIYKNLVLGGNDIFAYILVFGGNKRYYILQTYTEG